MGLRGDRFKVATCAASTAIWIATCGRPDVADVKKLQRVPSSLGTVSVWQHVHLSEQIRPRDTPACCWHVQQPTHSTHNSISGQCSTSGTSRPPGSRPVNSIPRARHALLEADPSMQYLGHVTPSWKQTRQCSTSGTSRPPGSRPVNAIPRARHALLEADPSMQYLGHVTPCGKQTRLKVRNALHCIELFIDIQEGNQQLGSRKREMGLEGRRCHAGTA